jgi:hypothetical protein
MGVKGIGFGDMEFMHLDENSGPVVETKIFIILIYLVKRGRFW